MKIKEIRVADFIAEFLYSKGIEDIFLLPGGGAMHLVDAVGKFRKLNVISCQHEQAVGIAAEAYGRTHFSGVGVAIVTSGPGATNIITPVAGAWIESVPLLIISGQVKRSDMMRGAKLRQKGVQEVDIVSLIKSVTKYSVVIEDPKDIQIELEKAINIAKTGRCGPVWIDVPLDVQGAPIFPDELLKYKNKTILNSKSGIFPETEIFSFIKNSKRPLIFAGHGIRLAGAAEDFKSLVEVFEIPIVSTWNALDLLHYDHKLYVGRPGVVALRAPNFAVQNCDLLICIGSRLDNILTAYNPKEFAPGAKKIIVDIDKNEIEKLEMKIDLKLNQDAAIFINNLKKIKLGELNSSWKDWREKCLFWKKKYPINDGKPIISKEKKRISHYRFVEILSETIPENTLITTGSSGLAVEVFYTVFRNKPGQRVFLTSGLGAMGYGLPAAIGACIGNSKASSILVESDGSLMFNLQELATLKSLNLPILILIMNNRGYASIRNTQKNYFSGRFVGTGQEAGIFFPNYKKVGNVFGIETFQVNTEKDLTEVINSKLPLSSPLLVDVSLEDSEILSPKVSAIPQTDGSIISMPLEDMSPLLSIEQLEKEMYFPLSKKSYEARKS